MVGRYVAAASALSLLAVGGSWSGAVERRSPLTVRQLAITANGAWSAAVSGEESRADCARFRLDVHDVRAYFAQAGQVDDQAYNHDLDMSRCHVTGTVRFADGRQGRWAIDRARRGVVTFATGKRLYLYCVDCTAAQFDRLDDEDRENGRALIRAARAGR